MPVHVVNSYPLPPPCWLESRRRSASRCTGALHRRRTPRTGRLRRSYRGTPRTPRPSFAAHPERARNPDSVRRSGAPRVVAAGPRGSRQVLRPAHNNGRLPAASLAPLFLRVVYPDDLVGVVVASFVPAALWTHPAAPLLQTSQSSSYGSHGPPFAGLAAPGDAEAKRTSSLVVNPEAPTHSAPSSRASRAAVSPARVSSVTPLVLAFVFGPSFAASSVL